MLVLGENGVEEAGVVGGDCRGELLLPFCGLDGGDGSADILDGIARLWGDAGGDGAVEESIRLGGKGVLGGYGAVDDKGGNLGPPDALYGGGQAVKDGCDAMDAGVGA